MRSGGLELGPGVHLRALGRLGSWVLHGDLGIGMSLHVGMRVYLCGRDKWVFVGVWAFVCLSVFVCARLCVCICICICMWLSSESACVCGGELSMYIYFCVSVCGWILA